MQVKDIRRETEECVSIAFIVPPELREAYQFKPGQYLTLRTYIDGEEVRRSYSICSIPGDEELRVAVKQVTDGRFSTFANEQLQVGESLDVMTPMGRFQSRLESTKGHYLAFAAGSGITPILSIMRWILETQPNSRFTLFYGNRSTESIIFREEIEGLKNRFLDRLSVHYMLSREHPGSELFYGRITAEKCARFFRSLVDVEQIDEAFICGPEEMIHDVRAALQSAGMAERQIHFELFTTNTTPKKRRPKATTAESVAAQVTIRLDGLTFDFPLEDSDTSILDGALQAGADLPYSCKGGVCSTCRARLLEGEVDMDVNWALEPEELAAGYILTCQSHPRTSKVVVDFDA